MKLSPLDVRKQEFSRGMRGYDMDEVRAFLQTVAGQMDDLIEEQVQAQTELDEYKEKMGHLEDVQEALQSTLNVARQNAEETRQTALTKAEMIIHEAHLKAEEIMKKADRELDRLRSDITVLETKRDQMLVKLRSVLKAEMELLDSYQPEPADRQIDSGVEAAGLAYIDPAARAHKEELLAKAVAAAEAEAAAANGDTAPADEVETVESESDDDSSQEPKSEANGEADQPPDVAEVVASLKAEVDKEADAPGTDGEAEDDEELGEMQKIRRILDDLE